MIQTKIKCNDLIKRQVESKPLEVQLVDYYNNPMSMERVTYTINGRNYERDTDDNGYASLNINLPVGTYTCTIRFDTVHVYSGCSATVNVKVVERYETKIIAEDVTKNYGSPGKVTGQVLLYNDEPVINRPVIISINDVNYTRTTDNNGYVSLNINLPNGVYSCKIMNPYDEYYEYSETIVIVKVISTTFMDGTNINKMEDETAVYQCAVYDELGRVQCNVRITVNGVTYTRHTESDGLAKLNIRLPAGEYDIIAEFDGDTSHTGSKIVNHISSKPYTQELTKYVDGVWIPGDNRGFMKSHIQVKQWGPETAEALGGLVFWDDIGQKFHKDIVFTNYEITETDPRVKTAKFTTSEYFDLTGGQLWVHISSPYHENFGGRILNVDFDKDKGLYTYQCQDGRRNYMTKRTFGVNGIQVYSIIQYLLCSPIIEGEFYTNISEADRYPERKAKLLSGLRPLDDYDLWSGVLKQNYFIQNSGEELSYDSFMDKIMNYGHYGGCPTDIYFTPEGVCQIEPIDIEKWIKTGFKLVHSDLTSYKYGFDTTNILTGVNFEDKTHSTIVNDRGETINSEMRKLGYYFGANIGMISPVTETVQTSDGNESSSSGGGSSSTPGINKGKTVVVACDRNTENDGEYLGVTCAKLEAAGYPVINLGIGPGQFSHYDWYEDSQGKVGVYLMADSTVSIADYASHNGFDYAVFGIRGDAAPTAVREWDTARWAPDGDCNSACTDWAYKTGQEKDDMLNSMGRGRVVKGSSPEELGNAILAAVNGENGSSGGIPSTSEEVDVMATYYKAQDEVMKQTRDLLSFEVKLPLNHTMFKNLHTNQMFFTELPKDFKLGNLAKIFKIMPIYKVTRDYRTSYQENRWYIDKLVIKCDSNGLFATLTLNVFPSPYSPYTLAIRNYVKAYEQAYNSNQGGSGGGSGGSGAGEARLGNDSTDTNSMACARGRGWGYAGDNENFDDCAKIGYAEEGTGYYEYARGFSQPIDLARDLANRFTYENYTDNHDANADVTWNGGNISCNCYDACRLVKCCFDAAGFDAVVITGTIYQGGHGWNAVKHNGRWYTFDLCYWSTGVEWQGTNSLRLADEW